MLNFSPSVPQRLVRPMVSTLHDLIAPLSEPEFAELLRTRSLVFRRGSNDRRFETLLDWETFRGVIANGYPSEELCVTRDGNPVLPHIYLQDGRVNAKNLAALLDHGASVIATRIEPHVPQLAALCADMREHIRERIFATAIATTGRGGALKLHYDAQDIVVVQTTGSKRWKIYDCPVASPVNGMPEQSPPQSRPIFDDTLRPGDFLFLPAGHWHHCENGPDRSLHLAIMIAPSTGWREVNALMRELMAEELFRIPLTRIGGPAEKAAHAAALKKRLHEKIDQVSFSQ